MSRILTLSLIVLCLAGGQQAFALNTPNTADAGVSQNANTHAIQNTSGSTKTSTSMFPPENCTSGNMMYMGWDGINSTSCNSGQDILRATLGCSEGQHVLYINGKYSCKTVPAPTACGTNEMLTFDGTNYSCVHNDVPTCGSGQVLTFNGSGFVCINKSDSIPTCNADQFLTYDGTAFRCADTQKAVLPPCADNQYVWADGKELSCRDFATPSGCSFDSIHLGDTLSYNLYNDLQSRGCDMSKPVNMTVYVDAGAIIGTKRGTSPASFDTGTGFQTGSKLKLVVNGNIIGVAGGGANGGSGCESGGAGGTALIAATPLVIENNGIIAGGGGGGARDGCNQSNWIGTGGCGDISGGGPGAGVVLHSMHDYAVENMRKVGFGGSTWDKPGTGAGGGANGGKWGQKGDDASCGATGGAGGDAINGNALINWVNRGTLFGAVK